jgi:tetratricopeptide (TPR) repeat protein
VLLSGATYVAKSSVIKYGAFLSSCHCDEWWSKWLYAALEGYRIDNDLEDRKTSAGLSRKVLRPIFRDHEDFAADQFPSDQTLAALEASRYLIVICSPNAARSKYLNEEIRHFKIRHGAENIIPVIVSGQPDDVARECRPPAVRFKVGTDGMLTWEQEEQPISIDARSEGDGKEGAKLKVAAALFGVSPDEMMRRVERVRQRRNGTSALLAAVLLAVAVAVTGSIMYAWRQLQTNNASLSGTLKTATQMVNTAVGQAEKYEVPRGVTLGFLGAAEHLLTGIARHGRSTKELRYRTAWMLIEFARNYEMLGTTRYQLTRAEAARRFMIGLAAEDPTNVEWQNDLLITYNEVGRMLATQGAPDEAISSYRDSLVIIERVAAADRENVHWQRNLSLTYFLLGGALFDQGALDEALSGYRQSLAISQRIPTPDAGQQGDLADIYFAIGNVLRAQGQISNALNSYTESITIFGKLAGLYPTTTFWHAQLAYSYNEIGNLFRQQRLHKEALQVYRDYLTIMKRLASADLNNTRWQQSLWDAYCKVGDMFFELRAFDEALRNHRHGLAVMKRLAGMDPYNSEWQRGMSLSYLEMGNVFMQLEELDRALESYRESLVISEHLNTADAKDTNIQLDLALLYSMIGDVLDKEGSQPEAIQSYRNGLVITERLATDDPNNMRNVFGVLDFQSRLAVLGENSVERLMLVVNGLRRLRSEIELTASQTNWLHSAESQLEKLSQVAVFTPDPEPDHMNAMALAPADALENVTSAPPPAAVEGRTLEATPQQKTAGGTKLQCREDITEQIGSDCTLGDTRGDGPTVPPSESEPAAPTPDILNGSETPAVAADADLVPAPAPSTKRTQIGSNSARGRDRDDSHSQRRDRHEGGSVQRRDRSPTARPDHSGP